MGLFQDTTSNALSASIISLAGTGYTNQILLTHEMAAGTTSSTTFKIRIGSNLLSTTITVNGSAGTQWFGGVSESFILIEEFTV
jgi:hypothetical protein